MTTAVVIVPISGRLLEVSVFCPVSGMIKGAFKSVQACESLFFAGYIARRVHHESCDFIRSIFRHMPTVRRMRE
jgi:hypothetical protein